MATIGGLPVKKTTWRVGPGVKLLLKLCEKLGEEKARRKGGMKKDQKVVELVQKSVVQEIL